MGDDAVVALLQAAFGEATFSAVWTEGQALSIDRVVRYALEEIEVSPGRSPA